jgi:hypothetical protein
MRLLVAGQRSKESKSKFFFLKIIICARNSGSWSPRGLWWLRGLPSKIEILLAEERLFMKKCFFIQFEQRFGEVRNSNLLMGPRTFQIDFLAKKGIFPNSHFLTRLKVASDEIK